MAASDVANVLERLKGTARDLVSLTNGVSSAELARRATPRDWSASMVVTHFADAELVYAVRVKQVLAEDGPHFAPYDENSWLVRTARLEEELRDTLARWRILREHTVRVLGSLEEAEWHRSGIHATRGEITMRQLVGLMAEHDRTHLDQLRRALAG